MYEQETIVVFLIAVVATLYLTKRFISRFHARGYVVKDMYKPGKPNIPTMGGVALIGGIMVSLVVAEIILRSNDVIEKLLIFYFIIIIYGIFGLLDDLIGVKSRFKKVYILYFLALPIALLNIGTFITIDPLNIHLYVGWVKPFLFAPIYVMVVANLVNMHAGFNGLDTGLTWILLFFTGIKAYMKFDGDSLLYLAPILGGLLAFLWYNKYPSRIFPGNSGSLVYGAAVGGLIILYGMEIFGVIILMPHIINFLMWIYWLANMRIYPHIKFARVLPDGTIKPPNKLTMKYLVTSLLKVNEPEAISILYAITTFFCILGVILLP
jgi:UDP-N-acetylglucosamine--dolichyl-phosphate N-acetylglucosaminephosphotransferase